MAVKEKAAAGLAPDTFVEGAGLLGDVNVKWKEVKFEEWDYDGKVAQAIPALKITMEVEDQEDAVDQYFSCGGAKDWTPSKDGKKLVAVGTATGINKSSNFAILMASLVEAGFPPEKIEDDCTVFEGLECHMIRVPAPKRPGLVSTPRADGKVYEKTNMVVDVISKLPWEAKGKKGTAAKGKAEPEESGVEDKATETIMAILEENPKGLDKKKLASAVFNALKTDPDRKEIMKIVYDDEFLGSGPWEFEKGIVKA